MKKKKKDKNFLLELLHRGGIRAQRRHRIKGGGG